MSYRNVKCLTGSECSQQMLLHRTERGPTCLFQRVVEQRACQGARILTSSASLSRALCATIIYIYICICMCICICICMYVCIYIYILYMYTYVNVYTQMCISLYNIYIYIYAYMCYILRILYIRARASWRPPRLSPARSARRARPPRAGVCEFTGELRGSQGRGFEHRSTWGLGHVNNS